MFAFCSQPASSSPSPTRVSEIFALASNKRLALPLYLSRVSAGFPSPAEDYVDGKLDLNEHLIEHPAATFFVRCKGNSMLGAGIHDGDLLVVDRAIVPTHGKVVVAVVHGELLVKRLNRINGVPHLVAEAEGYPPIPFGDDGGVRVWGVVTAVIHRP